MFWVEENGTKIIARDGWGEAGIENSFVKTFQRNDQELLMIMWSITREDVVSVCVNYTSVDVPIVSHQTEFSCSDLGEENFELKLEVEINSLVRLAINWVH